MGLTEALQELQLVVGRVLKAGPHPGARAPSLLLQVDLGGLGTREASVESAGIESGQLHDVLIVCAVHGDEVVVLAARSHAHGSVLVRPDREVEPGTIVA